MAKRDYINPEEKGQLHAPFEFSCSAMLLREHLTITSTKPTPHSRACASVCAFLRVWAFSSLFWMDAIQRISRHAEMKIHYKRRRERVWYVLSLWSVKDQSVYKEVNSKPCCATSLVRQNPSGFYYGIWDCKQHSAANQLSSPNTGSPSVFV